MGVFTETAVLVDLSMRMMQILAFGYIAMSLSLIHILKLRRKRLHFNKRAVDELFAQASSIQKEAKECHDALEQYYIDAVDFTFLEKAYQYLLTTL